MSATPLMTLSRPHPVAWVISLHSAPDNRLTPELLHELKANLDIVEAEWRATGAGNPDPKARGKYQGAGTLVITSSLPKFFSNGLDPACLSDPNFFESDYDPTMYRLMTFPLVTVAAINGHAFAGGMVLALSCDFRIMTSGKGMVSMNEILIGLPLPNSFNEIISSRLTPRNARDTMLGKRWTQPELLKEGILDEIVDDQGPGKEGAVLKRAVELGLKASATIGSGSWGAIKEGLYHGFIDQSRSNRKVLMPAHAAIGFEKRKQLEKLTAAKLAKL
ncbi:Enoyl-CoA delta isomerase 3 [Vanrija pseudolonga]|uniref:Enoyl-CoA delta isomerase 3 n=1 Tax=Vanrija pseudolonga TaxID=143232 RepID=A0AAF1BQP4_9TREE|nr:Enoyl-CoA delta isomerase 3 [Vanrija pseudolonga]